MPNPARRFYNRLARDYHLIYADWNAAIESQSRAIDRIVRSEVAAPPLALLDCACGIGTQAIGLALRGYRLHATDLSRPALQRARREARSRGAQLTFAQADLRDLGRSVASTFDVVICCDNSLAHMMTARDLARAALSIRGRLKPRGLFIASIRDYDRIVREHPHSLPRRSTPPPATCAWHSNIGIGIGMAGPTISICSSCAAAATAGRFATTRACLMLSCAASSVNIFTGLA